MVRIVIPLFFLIANLGYAIGNPKDYQIKFTVHNPTTDKILFDGYENITFKGNNVNKQAYFFDASKNLLQTEFVTFNKNDLQVVDYDYDNKITGEASKLAVIDKKIKIMYRESKASKEKIGTMIWEDNMYHGKTFHQLILRHWEKLSSGSDYDFKLLLPYRFEYINFSIVKKDVRSEGSKQIITFAIQPDSFFIRQFAPKLEAEYTVENGIPKIISFYGPTTQPINGETGHMVRIKFDYNEIFDKPN